MASYLLSIGDRANLVLCAGIVELCQSDDALKPFLNTIFRRDRVGLERNHQNKEAMEKMDQSLASLLTLLSRHFLKDAATKVLEFLIRQYRWDTCPYMDF